MYGTQGRKLFRRGMAALRDERGATAMEYGLIGVGIALTLVVATFALGDEVVGLFGDIQQTFAAKRS